MYALPPGEGVVQASRSRDNRRRPHHEAEARDGSHIEPNCRSSPCWASASTTSPGGRRSHCSKRPSAAATAGPTSVFFVNAHTLNLAAADPAYRDVAQLGRLRLRPTARASVGRPGSRAFACAENMVGTDFIPECSSATAGRGLLVLPAGRRRRDDRAWPPTTPAASSPAGAGRLSSRLSDRRRPSPRPRSTRSTPRRPDVLLVGMGNPIQEQWIQRHLPRLERAGLPGHRRAVRLLGGQRQPRPAMAAAAGPRMAMAALSAAPLESPPLSDRQPAVPFTGVRRAMAGPPPARFACRPPKPLTALSCPSLLETVSPCASENLSPRWPGTPSSHTSQRCQADQEEG